MNTVSRLALPAGLAMAVLLTSQTSGQTNFAAPVKLTDGAEAYQMTRNPNGTLQFDSTGRLHFVYWSGSFAASPETPSYVYYRNWTAAGGWSDPENIDDSTVDLGDGPVHIGGRQPALAIDANDTVWVTWNDHRHCRAGAPYNYMDNLEIYADKRPAGGNFSSTDMRLTTTSNTSNLGDNGYTPRIAAAPDGTIAVFWYDYNRNNGLNGDMYVKYSDTSGNFNLSEAIDSMRITNAPSVDLFFSYSIPDIGVDSSGDFYGIMTSGFGGASPLYFAELPNPQTVLSPEPSSLYADSGGYFDPNKVTVAPNDDIWVAYTDLANATKDLAAMRLPSGTGTFDAPIALRSNTAFDEEAIDLEVDGEGDLHVVWIEEYGVDAARHVFYGQYDPETVTWLEEAQLTEYQAAWSRPAITLDASNEPYIAFEESLEGSDGGDIWFVAPGTDTRWEQFASGPAGGFRQNIDAVVTSLDTLAWESGTGRLSTDSSAVSLDGGPTSPSITLAWGKNTAGDAVTVHAFRTDSGEPVWTSEELAISSFDHWATVSADRSLWRVYFATGDYAYCFDASTGATLWATELPEVAPGTPASIINGSVHIAKRTVFLNTYGGFSGTDKRIVALDALTGAIKWDDLDSGPGSDAPVFISEGSFEAVVSLTSGGIKAYDPADGTVLWSNDAPTSGSAWAFDQSLFGGLTYYDGKLFAPSYDFSASPGSSLSELAAVDAFTGELLWETTGVITGDSTPAIIDGKVVIAGTNGFGEDSLVAAYQITDGTELWRATLDDAGSNWNVSVAAANDAIYAMGGSGGSGLHILDPSDGSEIAAPTADSALGVGSPAIASDGTVFVHTTNGKLSAWRPSSMNPVGKPTIELSDQDGDTDPGITNDPTVDVDLSGVTADEMRLGEEPYAGAWIPFAASTTFTFTTGRRAIEDKTLYIQLRTDAGESPPYSATIQLETTTSVEDWMNY